MRGIYSTSPLVGPGQPPLTVLLLIPFNYLFTLLKKEKIIMHQKNGSSISSVKFVRITKKMRKYITSIWFYVILRTLWLPTLVSGPKKMILSFNMYYLRNFTTDVFIISFKLNETLYVLK